MIYVFDNTCFSPIAHYFPDRFPSFWEKFNQYVLNGEIISVREVYHELDRYRKEAYILDWKEKNKKIFFTPNQKETAFISDIFAIPHFQNLVKQKQLGLATPVADPFVIASAKIRNGCVVTDEKWKPNASKIPNVCKHFGIDCTNFEGFMERVRWTF